MAENARLTNLRRAHAHRMTINSAALLRMNAVRHAALVIIATVSFPAQPAATGAPLTTSAPALTTVIVDGTSVYAPAQLFSAYRDHLGRPLSRDAVRAISGAISAALAERYAADGFVKPEVRVDDSLSDRGILRVHVHEAQVTNVVIDGDAGRQLAALERIAAKLEGKRPLRQDDVPQAVRSMRAITGLSIDASTRRDLRLRNAFELVVKTDFSP